MEEEGSSSSKFTWKIDNFTKLEARMCYSETFIVGDYEWSILIFPKGNNTNHLSMYLNVVGSDRLLPGWRREASFSLILVNQKRGNRSVTADTRHVFNAKEADWGYKEFIRLNALHDPNGEFIVNGTLIVEAKVHVHKVSPPANVKQMDKFNSYFANLREFINSVERTGTCAGPSSCGQSSDPILGKELHGKKPLHEDPYELFEAKMAERLALAISTLSPSRLESSSSEGNLQKSIDAFQANFNEFVCCLSNFAEDRFEFELQNFMKDQLFTSLKMSLSTHISYVQLLENHNKETEEISKRKSRKDITSERDKIYYDWERLLTETEKVKTRYIAQEIKVAKAKEKRKAAEESIARLKTTWLS